MFMNKGKYVLYWMQAAQRVSNNAALEAAIGSANSQDLPLAVLFCVDDAVPQANLRHYDFMLKGLWETAATLAAKGIPLFCALGDMTEIVLNSGTASSSVICDQGYLHWQREVRRQVETGLRAAGVPYQEIETEAVVPVQVCSYKEEYSAATLRPKLLKVLHKYLETGEAAQSVKHPFPRETQLASQSPFLCKQVSFFHSMQAFTDWVTSELDLDGSVKPSRFFDGGYQYAQAKLRLFLEERFSQYSEQRNDPGRQFQSDLSPYLHFGQISPLELVHAVCAAADVRPDELPFLIRHRNGLTGIPANCAAFCEELLVRRELSFNYCFYNERYDSYDAIPNWARESLAKHDRDKRMHAYTDEQLECAQTDDLYWNAAQREMLITGKMHNYMRMYWGKKIIEWTADPEQAFYFLLYLNNRYELDGRDPNSFAGIAWCFGKHDRPWQERKIFGTVRYMNADGLKRKFDMQAYLQRISDLEG